MSAIETDHMLERALSGERGAVEVIWRSIAAGTASGTTMELWVTAIAQRVEKDVLAKGSAKDRAQRALTALHLQGRGDEHWAVKERLELLECFDDESVPGKPRTSTRSELALAIKKDELLKGLSDKQILRVIDHIQEHR